MSIIFPTYNCVFLHIPRTGGRNISKALTKYLDEHSSYLLAEHRHVPFRFLTSLFPNSMKGVDTSLIINRCKEEIIKSIRKILEKENWTIFSYEFLKNLSDADLFTVFTGIPPQTDPIYWYSYECRKVYVLDFEKINILIKNIEEDRENKGPIRTFIESGAYEYKWPYTK